MVVTALGMARVPGTVVHEDIQGEITTRTHRTTIPTTTVAAGSGNVGLCGWREVRLQSERKSPPRRLVPALDMKGGLMDSWVQMLFFD